MANPWDSLPDADTQTLENPWDSLPDAEPSGGNPWDSLPDAEPSGGNPWDSLPDAAPSKPTFGDLGRGIAGAAAGAWEGVKAAGAGVKQFGQDVAAGLGRSVEAEASRQKAVAGAVGAAGRRILDAGKATGEPGGSYPPQEGSIPSPATSPAAPSDGMAELRAPTGRGGAVGTYARGVGEAALGLPRRFVETFQASDEGKDTYEGAQAGSLLAQAFDFLPSKLHGLRQNIAKGLEWALGEEAAGAVRKVASFTPGAALVGDMPELDRVLDASGELREEARERLIHEAYDKAGMTGAVTAGLVDGVQQTLMNLKTFQLLKVAYGTAGTQNAPKLMRSAATFKNALARAGLMTATTPHESLKSMLASFGISLTYQSTPAVSGWINNNVGAVLADVAQNVVISSTQVQGLMETARQQAEAEGRPELANLYAVVGLAQMFGSDVVFGAMTRSFARSGASGKARQALEQVQARTGEVVGREGLGTPERLLAGQATIPDAQAWINAQGVGQWRVVQYDPSRSTPPEGAVEIPFPLESREGGWKGVRAYAERVPTLGGREGTMLPGKTARPLGAEKAADVEGKVWSRDADALRQLLSEAGKSEPPRGTSVIDEAAPDALEAPKVRTVEFPTKDLVVMDRIKQFKRGADPKTGVVRGQELQGKYERLNTGPILVWERADGKREVITGRNRFDLARRTGEETIPAQVVREADGFTQQMAERFDAEANIRDGQGEVSDYAHYFRNYPELTDGEARDKGLLARAKGKAGWAMGRDAADDLYSLFQAGRISEAKAVAIAQAAPKNAALQAAGMEFARESGVDAADVENFLLDLQRQASARANAGEQGDLFGFDDAALNESRAVAKAASRRQNEIMRRLQVLRAGSKVASDQFKKIADEYGINVSDPDALERAQVATLAELDGWKRWATDSAKVAELQAEVRGGKSKAAGPEALHGARPGGDELPPVGDLAAGAGGETSFRHGLRVIAESRPGTQATGNVQGLAGRALQHKAAALLTALDAGRIDEAEAARRWDAAQREVGRGQKKLEDRPGPVARTGDMLEPEGPAPGMLFGAKPGEAKVPPGPAQGAGTIPQPDWVLQKGETPDGSRLVRRIAQAADGTKVGMRTIVDYVNDAVRVEMRKDRSQTTKRHPAQYRPTGHVTLTSATTSQINFHEAGHGLKELVEARAPGWFGRFEGELLALTQAPGSMASAKNVHEGVAEWMRLRMMDPTRVEQMAVTQAIQGEMDAHYPRLAARLRDGARAMHALYERPADVRWSMFANAPRQVSVGDVTAALVRGGQAVANYVSSGGPLSRIDRQLFREIVKGRREVGQTLRQAVESARQARKGTKGILDGYNMVLQIGTEVQGAITGQGPLRGVKVIGADGNYKMVLPRTWQEIVHSVPSRNWTQFQEAGWAKEALNRYEKDGLEYPGMYDGIRPEDLRAIVAKAKRDIPAFEQRVKDVQAFFDALLDVKEFGGLKAPGEVEAMRRRGDYWPLPRVMENRAGTVRAGGNVQAGDYRARGSAEAIKDLSQVAEERARDTYTAYYWNRLGLRMADTLSKVAQDAALPVDARALAGRVMLPLRMSRKVTATATRAEVQEWIYEDILRQKAAEMGVAPDMLRQAFKPENINLSWEFQDVWRPTAPKDVRVVSLLRNGERQFFQVGDDAMFRMFAEPAQAGKAVQFFKWAVGPTMQNWKRMITQSLPFTANNISGDLFNQVMLNPDRVGWFPGGATMLGAMNRFTKKYPQVFQEGLLLSRVEPSSVEMLNKVRHNALWQFLTEGFYVSQHKDPAVRLMQTLMQPSNWLFPVWKVGDLVNFVTFGKFLAPRAEGATREGAAVHVLQRGGTDEEAMHAYWRVTGTFNEHAGSADARALMSTPGFFNPMLQAARGAAKNLTDPDPAVSGAAWAKLLLLIPGAFGGAAGARYLSMTEEDVKKERERPVDDRMNYHDVAGYKMRFPYGPEGAMAALVYNSVMDELLERPRGDSRKQARSLLSRMGGISSVLEFMGPQARTMIEANMNWSTFRQQHIISPWMTGLPKSEQYYSTTPEFYRKLGQWIDYPPAALQYIVQNGLARQVDETIQLLDEIERDKPLRELADLPFVGRMFMREPMGFWSASVQSVQELDARMKLLDSRLRSSGYSYLRDMSKSGMLLPDPRARALQVQLMEVERLRQGADKISVYSKLAKAKSISQDWDEEHNMRRAMTRYAQAILAANPKGADDIALALDLLAEMDELTPDQKAGDYLRRAF